MERLTTKREWKEAKDDLANEYGYSHIWNRLREIEDILGDNYDLYRLRELVEADRDGRCVVLPVPLHSVLLDMSDISRPDILKDFRISATWTHKGIVFHCPWNIFNQNIEKGFISLVSESAEAALKGKQNEV